MAELGAYYITIMPSMKGFSSAVNKELGDLGNSGGKNFSNGFMDVLKGSAIGTTLGNLATKAGSALVGGLKEGIGRLDTLENFPRVMQAFGYSADEAGKSIERIREHLIGLPTPTQDMVKLTQAISDSTGDLDLATRAALGFNDMMLANGASAAEMTTAQEVLNRVLGKGSATVAQWGSLTSVMPTTLDLVAKKMLGASANSQTLYEALSNGTVGWNDFLRAIAELDESGYIDEAGNQLASFEEMARANSNGIATAIENIPHRIARGWEAILKVIGQGTITQAINDFSDGIANVMTSVAGHIDQLKQRLADLGAFEKLQTIMQMLGEKFSSFGGAVSEAVNRAIPVIANLIDKGLQWIIDHGESIGHFVDTIAGAFGKVAEVVGGALSGVMPVLGNLIDKVLTWILDHGELVVALLGAIAAKMAFDKAVGAAETITGVAKGLGTLGEALGGVEKLGELPTAFKMAAEAGGPLEGVFSKLSKGVGGLGKPIETLKGVIPSVTSAFGSLGSGIGSVSSSVGGLGGVLSGVAVGPIVAIVAAIAALAAAFKTLWDNNEGFRNAIMGIWNGIVSKVQEALGKIGEALKPIGELFGSIAEIWSRDSDKILGYLGKLWEFVCNVLGPAFVFVFSSIGSVIRGLIDIITGVFQIIGGVVKGFMTGDWSMAAEGLKSIWNGFIEVLSAPFQAAFDAIGYVFEQFGTSWDEVIGGITGAWNDFCGKLNELWTGLQQDWSNFCGVVGREWESMKSTAEGAFNAINSTIKQNLDDAKTVGESTVGYFAAAVNGDWKGMQENGQKAFETIDRNVTNHLTSMKNSGIPIVSELASGALEKWEWLKTEGAAKFENLAQDIANNLGNAKEWAEQKGREIQEFWESIPDRIIGFFSGIGDRISEAFGSIHFPSPHISWENIGIGDVSIPIPNIEWYAKGGVFDTATLIGVGEAGREAALPLNAKTYGEIARGISGEMGGSDVADEIRALREDVQRLQLVVQLDSGAIAGGVYPYIDSRMETQRRRAARK